jgi:hypothetical protein
MRVFKYKEDAFEVDLMPEVHGKVFLNRLRCKNQNNGKEYVLSQQKNTLEWQCSCIGCRFSVKRCGRRECKHLRAMGLLGLKPGDPPPQAIIDIIGESRWYAQQARRFGEVKLATQ